MFGVWCWCFGNLVPETNLTNDVLLGYGTLPHNEKYPSLLRQYFHVSVKNTCEQDLIKIPHSVSQILPVSRSNNYGGGNFSAHVSNSQKNVRLPTADQIKKSR